LTKQPDMSTCHLHLVEDEELGLGAEVGGVAQAGRLHVGLGALGQRARVALVGLAVARLDDVAAQEQRRLLVERVDVGRVGVGHQQHVRGLDALPAGDRRAVEGVAGTELVLVEVRHRHRHVLFLAAGVGEAEVDELDFVVLHHLHHVGNCLGHRALLAGSLKRLNSYGAQGCAARRHASSCTVPVLANLAESVPRNGAASGRGCTIMVPSSSARRCAPMAISAPVRGPARRRAGASRRAGRRRPDPPPPADP
jgi:hypothetical protein